MGDGEGATINLPLPGDSGKARWGLLLLAELQLMLMSLQQERPLASHRHCLCLLKHHLAPPPAACAGHEAMLAAFDEVVEPAARRFCPDIILVSAGYDAHWRDPLAGLQLRSSSYHALGGRLAALAGELCGGRLVMLLEGGYDLKALGESVANTFLGELFLGVGGG